MEAIQRLTPLDFVLMIVWAFIVGWGVKSGMIRQAILVAVVYVSTLAAAQLYRPLGGLFTYGFGQDTAGQGDVVAYVSIFVLVAISLAFFIWRTYPNTMIARHRRVDAVGGGVFGGLWAALLLIFVVTALRFYVVAFSPKEGETQRAVDTQIQRSQLVPGLAVSPLWLAMAPWFPERVPARLPR